MGELVSLVTPLHKKTPREFLGRMNDGKVECMKTAKRYDKDFWDGDRRCGYGGYRYDGRYEVVAKALIDRYGLSGGAKILDVGCGKGFLLYEFTKLLPGVEVTGFDISGYALQNAKQEVKPYLINHMAQDPYEGYGDNQFDLVVSLTTLHNLTLPPLRDALKEIERVGENKYVVVESYRNELELFNLQCWAFTCEAFFRPEEWVWLFEEFGYMGDYEFIYFD